MKIFHYNKRNKYVINRNVKFYKLNIIKAYNIFVFA